MQLFVKVLVSCVKVSPCLHLIHPELFSDQFYFQPDNKDREEGLVNYTGSSGTSVRSSASIVPGTENIMSEMARRLKERRAKAEGTTVSCHLCTVF